MKTRTQRDYEERLLRVLVHIQTHLDETIDLPELARIACFSPFHFHRVFRGMVGEPVKEHVRRLRLERAAYRLKVSDEPVTRLAFEAGYETHESFTRAFSAHFGHPPSKYRELHRLSAAPAIQEGIHYTPDGRLNHFDALQSKENMMDVRIESLPEMTVAFVRHIGPYNQVGEAWERLCGWAGPRMLLGPKTKMLGASYDDPEVTPPDKIRYDACILVKKGLKPSGDIGVQTIGGMRYAVTTHKGPYEQLGETYAALMGQWMPANGHEPDTGPSLEFYLNNPQDTPPAELLTDIHVPLKDTP